RFEHCDGGLLANGVGEYQSNLLGFEMMKRREERSDAIELRRHIQGVGRVVAGPDEAVRLGLDSLECGDVRVQIGQDDLDWPPHLLRPDTTDTYQRTPGASAQVDYPRASTPIHDDLQAPGDGHVDRAPHRL